MAAERAGDLHPEVSRSVERYLAVADRLLPGRVCGFYVVGSTALGAYRPGRSDIDFVAVVDGGFAAGELRRLRLLQVASGMCTAPPALARLRLALPGTVNGAFVAAADLTTPVTRIRPLASHSGRSFRPGSAFDVNPVMWKVLAERGIAVRGPEPVELGLDPEPALLRAWNHANLHRHWQRGAEAALAGPPRKLRLPAIRSAIARGVLGAPRLHHTMVTGEVVSKEAAGEYALETFESRWHPVIREGLAYWRGEPGDPRFRDWAARTRQTARFVLEVVASADRL